MTIDNASSQSLMRTVCSIEGTINEFVASSGHGVFVRPNVVLTCWHVLRGKKDLIFANDQGDEATMVRHSPLNKKKSGLDLALVEISRPLSPHGLKFATTSDYLYDKRGTMITRFNGHLTAHNVGLDYSEYYKDVLQAGLGGTHIFKHTFNQAAGLRTYHSDKAVRPGYSGSPIFDARGQISSLVSAIPATSPGGQSTLFYGVSPVDLSNFLRNALG